MRSYRDGHGRVNMEIEGRVGMAKYRESRGVRYEDGGEASGEDG